MGAARGQRLRGLERIMQDSDIRKALGRRIKDLRKRRQWTQKELAAKLGVQFSHLNKYESGLHAPPVEKLVRLAQLLETSVDFLLTGVRPEGAPLESPRLLERFRAVGELSPSDQEAVLRLIDAMIVKQRVEGALKPLDKKSAG